ncbi:MULTISPECIES: phosphate signaling complex protein PhoU [unclassified Cellvibrio]|uniref:phosphate signaling complex protein PhoU n=1 Tax=unclassified Cellvibrio TaxID=2624793 RepID=UPI0009D9FDD4|nr:MULTISPECIES: phosphate signaling complex protein PhoU [unclassified Cellvibrio]QEY14473.1 phosphate transport system regulatory protein PhoU [Cellvibrio sp. KY-YJ-3]UUA74503.1 phosphate signaling complex protein PhoU [Cellvibrio sp. QJXJ]
MDITSHTHHISQQYNIELEAIRTHLSEMGGMAQRQVNDAIQALIDADVERAEQVVRSDTKVNSMEVTIDEECVRILARRQPAASDLRLVIAVTKAITDLERIGDEATKIARQAIAMNKDGLAPRGYIEVRHIGGHVSHMLQDALDAFARLDMQLALTVVQTDKQVDMEYSTAMRELVTFMIEDPRSITRVLNIMWSLRALERIGDHARNLAQYVIYLVNGEDVRHANLEQITENVNAKDE